MECIIIFYGSQVFRKLIQINYFGRIRHVDKYLLGRIYLKTFYF